MTATEVNPAVIPRKVIPPHYFFAALLLMTLLGALGGGGLLGASWRWLGALIAFAAVSVAALAARQFARAGTEIRPLSRSTALVTDGMFRWSRNPMYVSMITGLVGVALMLDSVAPWAAIPFFAALLHYRFVRHEEALMEQTFGQPYRDYRERVRRWV